MIAIVMMIFSLAGAVGVFLVRLGLFGIFVAQDKKKNKEEPRAPEYVYTQLESWAEEISFKHSLVRKYRETQKMLKYNVKKQEQIGNKIIQLQKQIATAEKNIIVNCEKYNIDPEEYLY